MELGLAGSLLAVLGLAVLQALLFSLVLPRVRGITFALVTLGFASVFAIVIQSSDLQDLAGAEIGLQGVRPPVAFLDTTNERFVFYLITVWLRCTSAGQKAEPAFSSPETLWLIEQHWGNTKM